MKRQLGFTLPELIATVVVLGVGLAAVWGYIWNIIKLVAIVDGGVTGMLILRAVGLVVVPLGCIVGYL